MLFRNRKQNRRSNRSQPSQRRKSTTRRLQLLEKLEDRRLMAVAGGFEEQLLRFELDRGEYSRSLRGQVQQDRYRSGRFELRQAARTLRVQPIDNGPADIQRPNDGDQKPGDDDVKPKKENEQPVSKEDSSAAEVTPTTPPAADPTAGGDSFWDARSRTKVEESSHAKDETSPLENSKLAPQAVELPSVDAEMSFDVEGFLAPDKSGAEAVGEEKEKADDTGDADKPVDKKPISLTVPEELEGSHDFEYRDEGATCKDQVDQGPRNRERTDRSRRMSSDRYRIRYDCDDVSGNQAQRPKRPVVIQDHTRPQIQLIQPGKGFQEAGFPYTDRGAEAKDSLDGENQNPQTEPAGGTGPELGVGLKNNPNPLGNVPAKGDGQQPPVPVNPNNGAPSILADLQQQRADLQRQYQENERRQREVRVGDEGIVVDEVAFISLLEEMHYLQDRLSELDEAIESFNPKNQEVGQDANVVNVISADQIGDLMQDFKSDDPQVREKAADTLFKALQEFHERLGFLGNLSDVDRQFIMDFVEQFAATDQQTRAAVVDQLRKYIVENELSSIGGMSILESQLREHGKDFQLPDYVTDPGTDDTVDEGDNGDNGPGKDGGEKPGQELENGNQKNENPVGDVPAKQDERQPPVAGNQNNGAAEQTLEELQEKREELQRQHQENERQQNELEKAGEEGSFDEEKFINLLDEMHRLLVQLGELDEKILEKLYKQGAELEQQHQENERKLRELDQDGEMDAAQEAEFIELLGEMHRLRDQLQKLYEKIGGITSQNAVNGQEGPAVENPGDAEQPQKLNFSPEEKEAFRRRFGLSEDQMDELLEEGSLKDKGRIFSVFEHADGPPLILVTEPDPGPAVDNPNDKEEKAGTPEDQKSDQKGNGDKPDDSQEPKDPDNGKKQGALDGTDKLAMLPRRIVVVDSLPPVIQLPPLHPGKYESSRDPVSPDAGPNCRDFVDGQLPPESQEKTDRKDSTHYKIRYNCPDPAVPRDQAENRPVVVEDRKLPRVQVDGVNKVFSEAGFPYTDDGKVEDLPDLTDPNVPEPFGQPQPHDLIWGNVDFTKGAEKQPQGQVEKVIQPNQAKLEDGVEDRLSERETRLLESARERVTRAATEHGRAVAEANAAAEALRKCEKDVAELRDKHDASKAEVDAVQDALKKAEAELENYQSDVDAASRELDRVDRQFWTYAKYRSIARGQDGRTSGRYREAQEQLDRGNDQHNEAGRRYSEVKGSLADRQAAVAAAKENLKAAQAAEQAAQKALNAKEKECQRVDEKQGQANAAETRAAKEVDQANTAAQETATQVTKSSKLRREAAEAQERADREAARQREEDRQKAEQEKQRQEDAKDPAVKKFEAWMGKRFKALDVNDPVDRSMVARVYYAETGVLEAGVNAAALIPNIVSPPSSNGAVGIFRTIGRGLVNTFHGLKDYATGWVR